MKDAWHQRITILLSQHARVLVLSLAGLMFLSGAVYSYQLGGRLRYPDEHEYLGIAQNLAAGRNFSLDGQHPTAFRPPGYPAVLSVLLAMGLPVFALRIFNFAALCASAMALYALLRPRSAVGAVIGAALVLLYPLFFYTAGTLYPQTVASALFLLILFLYFRSPSPPLRVYALIGLVFAALIFTVPQFIFVLGFLILWDMVARPAKRLKRALAMTATCLLVLAPWMARNYAVFDSFVFISDNSGLMLILGNSENTTPNAGPNADISRYREASTGMNEIQMDRFYTQQAVAFIRDEPGSRREALPSEIPQLLQLPEQSVGKGRTEPSTRLDLPADLRPSTGYCSRPACPAAESTALAFRAFCPSSLCGEWRLLRDFLYPGPLPPAIRHAANCRLCSVSWGPSDTGGRVSRLACDDNPCR